MTPELATQILSEAAKGGYYTSEIPEDEDKLTEEGQYFLDEARRAKESGMNDPTIDRIIELGGEERPIEGSEVDLPPRDKRPEEVAAALAIADSVEDVREALTEPVRDTLGTMPERGRPEVERGLAVPAEIQGEATPMPRDLTQISDMEVRKLHGEYNALLARATWLVAITASDLMNAEHLRDDRLRRAIRGLDRIDPDTEKPKLSKVLEAEAAEDPGYREWEERVRQHEQELEQYKALKEIYKGNVAVLSREASMRNDEFTRSGGR